MKRSGKSFLFLSLFLFFSGDCLFAQSGVKEVIGKIQYGNYTIGKYFSNGSVVMLDASSLATKGQAGEKFVAREGQVLGQLTKPLTPSPSAYAISLPVVPKGIFIDVDQNGKKDKGVQIFSILFGLNFRGDSYLDQLEQAGLSSVLSHPKTGQIAKGSLLIYSADDLQGFPSGLGKDKILFTADDPIVKVMKGYTVANIDSAGIIRFDRNALGTINIMEEEGRKTPDFSKQSLLESYHSLINLLKERYAYTKLRKIDWEGVRGKYLEEIKDADSRKDTGDYYIVIRKLVRSMKDAHVQANSYLPSVSGKALKMRIDRFSGSIGADLTRLSDGRYVVSSVYDSTPAKDAGWKLGTEILNVNGKSIQSHIDTIPIYASKATEESINLEQTLFALAFPVGYKVEIKYRQQGSQEIQTRTMTAIQDYGEEIKDNPCDCPSESRDQISYKYVADGEIGYIQWPEFDNLPITINVYENFLAKVNEMEGIIIDMRKNSGGLLQLMYTMASYMFTADKPAPLNWLDFYVYDEEVRDFVKQRGENFFISAPVPELAYQGKVVVLVDNNSASAGEYLPQFLQKQRRATIIGEYASEGAGGTLSVVTLPGPFLFTFTGGQTYFAGTKEVNLEGKGVQPDIRVPVTLENIIKKKNCGDPVLDEAIKFLKNSK